jgi:hypothetical protein
MSLGLKRRLAATTMVLAVFGGGAATAIACHGDGTATASLVSLTTLHRAGAFHSAGLGSTVTGYLGLSAMQIKADLKAGQTLAQIANATPGKSAAGLVAAITASLKTKLDAAVTAGKLSATTESAIMTRLNTKVTAVVNGQWHWWWHRHT